MKVEEIEVEAPKSDEVRVKLLCASVCHTDLLFRKSFPFPLFPRVLGHEGVGVVESTGDEVKDLKEGDVVMPLYIGECKECENCKSGKTNLCLKYPLSLNGLMADGTSRMSIRGQKLYHAFSCSTWSEFMVINANYVVKIDPSFDPAHACLLSCGFSSGFGSTWKHLETGSTVAIIGLGAVGLGAVEGARLQGASKIIGIDINEKKREKGKVLGITDFINPKTSDKSVSELVKDITDGMGVDYCIECSGVSTMIDEGLKATKVGKGTTIVIGAGMELNVQLSLLPLVVGGTVKGCCFGGLKTKTDLPLVLNKCSNKEFHLNELLTHEVQLGDINNAFHLMKQEDYVKILVKM